MAEAARGTDALIFALKAVKSEEFSDVPDEDSTGLAFSEGFYDITFKKAMRETTSLRRILNTTAKRAAAIAALIAVTFSGMMTVRAIREPVVEFIVNTGKTISSVFTGKSPESVDTETDTDTETEGLDFLPVVPDTIETETETDTDTDTETEAETETVTENTSQDTEYVTPVTKETLSGVFSSGVRWTYYREDHELVVEDSGFVPKPYNDRTFNELIDEIESMVFKEPVTGLGYNLFKHYPNIKKVTLPEGITEIAQGCFAPCKQLEEVKLPTTLKKIGSGAFSLDSLNTNDYGEAKYLGIDGNPYFALIGADDNITECTVNGSVMIMADNALSNKRFLKRIILEDGASESGICFKNLSLDEITFCDGTTHIPSGLFSKCQTKTVRLPESLVSVDESAIELSASGTVNVIFAGSDKKWSSVNAADGWINYKGKSATLNLTFEKYEFDGLPPKQIGNLTWEFDIDTGTLTFSGNGALCRKSDNFVSNGSCFFGEMAPYIKHIVIENGVDMIGGGAFAYLENLETVVLPSSLTTIGYMTFYGDRKLTTIDLPAGLTEIDQGAFRDCNIKKLKIPNGTVAVGAHAFSGCPIIELYLGKRLEAIGAFAFDDIWVKELTFYDRIKTIGARAFGASTSLKTIYFPESSADKWERITISGGNDCLIQAEKIFGR